MCEDAGINQSAIQYRWQVAMPLDEQASRLPFETINDLTPFTDPASRVLDSIYFRPHFQLRCVAQPIHSNGNIGTPLKSRPVAVSSENGVCSNPVNAGNQNHFNGQSFVTKLRYLEPTDEHHPNTIHISVRVPHQDGMLPLISTQPIHNLRYLLAEPIYRQQHSCSNFVHPPAHTADSNADSFHEQISSCGFLDFPEEIKPYYTGNGYPYQYDTQVRGDPAIDLYRHLNLKSCTWTFDAWYHISDLVDFCGGEVVSDFERQDIAKSHLTLHVPLYVSYIYPTAPRGWASIEHRTKLELSIFYNTMQWRAGLETEGQLSGRLQLLKVATADNGNLVIDFKTQTKFRGKITGSHNVIYGEW